jgi:hypothetical protein
MAPEIEAYKQFTEEQIVAYETDRTARSTPQRN